MKLRRYVVKDGILEAPLDEGDVFFNPETGQYHLLNGVGRGLLGIMGSGSTLADAVGQLSARFGADEKVVMVDSQNFVLAMLDRDLVEEV